MYRCVTIVNRDKDGNIAQFNWAGDWVGSFEAAEKKAIELVQAGTNEVVVFQIVSTVKVKREVKIERSHD